MALGKSAVEDLEMKLFSGCYHGKKVLITGHTGFKGSWLAYWLSELGAEIIGVALPPATCPNLWDLLRLNMVDHRIDIRDGALLSRLVADTQPEIVFHLAAQSLVRRSYRNPLEAWTTNVMGTVNLLEACRESRSVRAIVVVTTDKVYENRESSLAYHENEKLGGHDPYSASKAASELVAASYRKSYFNAEHMPLLATARAGNAVGGGDWSEDRLIPDLVRATVSGALLEIRSPEATRPWQHVLECLSGYLLLGQMLLEGRSECAAAWNFGPGQESNISVSTMLTCLSNYWPEAAWRTNSQAQPHEAGLLSLDSSKAQTELGWRPVWNLDETLRVTADWYQAYIAEGRLEHRAQLAAYVNTARLAGLAWSGL